MTDEEKAIKAVCEECESYWYCFNKQQLGDCVYNRMYIKGLAESRKELEQWKQEWQDAQIQANEEGFARTTIQIKYKELEKEIAELKAQIKKMRRCTNCKLLIGGDCPYMWEYKETRKTKKNKDSYCVNYDKWELAE